MTVAMLPTLINQRWTLLLPEHRAARAEWWDGWEKERVASMAENIGPGDLVFDIGSEEGDFPALWASWGADVVLFEPNPRVWPNIKVIFETNGLTDRVRGTFVGFAGDVTDLRVSDLSLTGKPPVEGGFWRGGGIDWPGCADGPVIGDHGFCVLHERPDIPRVTLDDFSASGDLKPTVLTLDVEGAELKVLRGAKRILAEDRPLVYVSVHPDFMPQYGDTADQLHAYMRAAGYLGELLAIDHEEHHRYTPSERV